MKIGIVISGGDVSGMNNFIFQIAGQANADITLFNGGIPGYWRKVIRIWRGAIWLIIQLRGADHYLGANQSQTAAQ